MGNAIERWTGAMRGGRWAEAWAIDDAILAARDPATRDDPLLPPHRRWVWDGTPLAGRAVLVRCYHGLGDTLQFARYLPALAAVAASVTVEAPAKLVPLMRTAAGGSKVVAADPAAPRRQEDAAVEITELAFALRLPPDAVPVPYLAGEAAALPAGTTGLCHASGEWDRARDLPPELLRGVAERGPAVTLVAEPSALRILNPKGCPFDMAATAALVAGAARVVSVDTMIAHLAGALGVPTFLLLRHAPDWRWDPAARGSVWYPSVRQFVQPSPGDWAEAVAALEQELG